MQIQFYKYQGTGNDFILIDNRAQKIVLNTTQIQKLCNRHFGIGADGLMLLESEVGFDFKMVYYNSDGNQSSMCGNGGRCITNFAKRLGIIKDKAQFIAIDGPHESVVDAAGVVSLKMLEVKDIESGEDFYFLNTGSPHVVKFVDKLEKFDLIHEGSLIRHSARFLPDGTNVNFVEKTNDVIFVRTYERGVEDETFSCGTGVTAAAIVCSVNGLLTSKNSAIIHTRGGTLEVTFEKVLDKNFYDIWLKGPAELVFEGAFTLNETVNNS